jgi:hypothetical protein
MANENKPEDVVETRCRKPMQGYKYPTREEIFDAINASLAKNREECREVAERIAKFEQQKRENGGNAERPKEPKVDFSGFYGELKGSGRYSELWIKYDPRYQQRTSYPFPMMKFRETEIPLKSSTWKKEIRRFLKQPAVMEVYPTDMDGNIITRTVKIPELKTEWHLV